MQTPFIIYAAKNLGYNSDKTHVLDYWYEYSNTDWCKLHLRTWLDSVEQYVERYGYFEGGPAGRSYLFIGYYP